MAIAVVCEPELSDLRRWAAADQSWSGAPFGVKEEVEEEVEEESVHGGHRSRPALRLVADEPRPARRRASAKVLRRRLLAAGVLGVGILVSTLSVGTLLGPAGSVGPGVAQPSIGGALPVSLRAGQGTFYIVQPGDTLRSIAARIAPADPERMAKVLSARLGSDRVVAGEHIPLA